MNYEETINKYGRRRKINSDDKSSFFEKLLNAFSMLDIETIWHIVTHPENATKIFNMIDLGLIIAAVAYVVMPLDAVPDFIPGLGLLDDAAIITFILHKFATLIEKYRNTFMKS
uniref:DUF1232 domain-containing protein n=1 Tax=Desulfatirhabdium butyrativorans TaxID=340467 RepID=A0A7C4MLC3_9BACT